MHKEKQQPHKSFFSPFRNLKDFKIEISLTSITCQAVFEEDFFF